MAQQKANVETRVYVGSWWPGARLDGDRCQLKPSSSGRDGRVMLIPTGGAWETLRRRRMCRPSSFGRNDDDEGRFEEGERRSLGDGFPQLKFAPRNSGELLCFGALGEGSCGVARAPSDHGTDTAGTSIQLFIIESDLLVSARPNLCRWRERYVATGGWPHRHPQRACYSMLAPPITPITSAVAIRWPFRRCGFSCGFHRVYPPQISRKP